jgi:predicted RNA-binding protein YlqC (UPF0109 family)
MESSTEEPEKLADVIRDSQWIEVVVLKTSIGALASRTGVSVKALRNTITRQKNGGRTPKINIALHNQATIDQAIKRAVVAALTD